MMIAKHTQSPIGISCDYTQGVITSDKLYITNEATSTKQIRSHLGEFHTPSAIMSDIL